MTFMINDDGCAPDDEDANEDDAAGNAHGNHDI